MRCSSSCAASVMERATAELTRDLSVLIDIDTSAVAEDLVFRLKTLLDTHHGDTPVFLVLRNQKDERITIQVGRDSYVKPDGPFLDQMVDIVGKNRVLVNRLEATNRH